MSRFVAACTDGDLSALLEVLADDITVWSDGGGKVAAARQPIYGAERVARFFLGLMGKAPPSFEVRTAWINSQLALVGYAEGQPFNVLTFDTSLGRIEAIRIVVNLRSSALCRRCYEKGGLSWREYERLQIERPGW